MRVDLESRVSWKKFNNPMVSKDWERPKPIEVNYLERKRMMRMRREDKGFVSTSQNSTKDSLTGIDF